MHGLLVGPDGRPLLAFRGGSWNSVLGGVKRDCSIVKHGSLDG